MNMITQRKLSSLALRLGCLALFALISVAPAAKAALTRTEVWRGAYRCAQGMTGVTLTLLVQPGGRLQGLFEFYPVAANPAVSQGCFEMAGVIDPEHRVTLTAGLWRRQPAGYVTVGLTGQEIDANRLIGTIDGPGCSTFALVRQTTPAQPSACASVVS